MTSGTATRASALAPPAVGRRTPPRPPRAVFWPLVSPDRRKLRLGGFECELAHVLLDVRLRARTSAVRTTRALGSLPRPAPVIDQVAAPRLHHVSRRQRGEHPILIAVAIDPERRGQVDREALREFERSQLRSALIEGVTERYLAMLAFEYVRAVDRGQANINDYLAELVGKPVGTVRGHLIRAHRDGLLSGTHGRKGSQLSPTADDLVESYALAWFEELNRLARTRQSGIVASNADG